MRTVSLVLLVPLLGCTADAANDPLAATASALSVIAPVVTTPPHHNYKNAPRTPDVDDAAIWEPTWPCGQAPFVIGTLKNGGLEVYDLAGRVLQTISPPQRQAITSADPRAPGAVAEPATGACPESASGATFGRFNNVDIVRDFPLRRGFRTIRTDVAVVSDRGCDRLHFYAIDPDRRGGPLVDITAQDVPRVFPERLVRPSPVQSPGVPERREANPLDDQNTAYGLALYGRGRHVRAAVTQEHRNTIALVDLRATRAGTISYRVGAELHFPSVFTLPNGSEWTPEREEPEEDLQFEGLVFDEDHDVLYAGQEIIGVWAIPLDGDEHGHIEVSPDHLIEKVQDFGGEPGLGGGHLVADVEGLAIYYRRPHDAAYLVVSSQGSNAYHVYDLDEDHAYLGAFQVAGVAHTDGVALSRKLLVVQNGDAPPPASTADINGYRYKSSAQLMFLRWRDVATQLGLDF